MFYGMMKSKHYDYGFMMWEDIKEYLATENHYIPYHIFWNMIIEIIMIEDPTINRRSDEPDAHCIIWIHSEHPLLLRPSKIRRYFLVLYCHMKDMGKC